jgi:hypothetical protein
LARLAALAKPLPEFVDLRLRSAIDDQRDCRCECELRAAVERQEFLALDLEQNRHDRAGRTRAGLAVARRREDAPRFED